MRQVWALAISTDERTIVSGAADSVVTFWEDCTEALEKEKEVKRADMVQRSTHAVVRFGNLMLIDSLTGNRIS
jgi:hypothetical protein